MGLLDVVIANLTDARSFGILFLLKKFLPSRGAKTRVVATKYGAFTIRNSSSDIQTLRSVYGAGCYDLNRFEQRQHIYNEYRRILLAGSTPIIVDAGANIGLAAHCFARSYPDAIVLAVEPDEGNLSLCRLNTAGLQNVSVVPAAIGSSGGTVRLDYSRGDGDSVRTERADSGVSVLTIAELRSRVPNGELFIVKVDIEGFEKDLFSSATDWVREPFVVIIEPHDWMLPGSGSSFPFQNIMLNEKRELLVSGENLIWVRSSRGK